MIFKRNPGLTASFGLVASCILAGCSTAGPDLTPREQALQSLAAGQGLAAEVTLKEMLAAGTDRTELAAFLGEAELQQGEFAEARQWLEDGAFTDATRGHGFHMLARLEMQSGNLPVAGAAFDEALKFKPDSADLWVDIGRLRYSGGEQSQAIEASIHAVKLDSENAQALRFRAQLIRDSEGMRAAIPWFERALERNPDNADLLLDYAATLGELGRARDMLAVIRDVAVIDPANKRIYFLQAVLAARGGNYDLAGLLLLRSSRADQEMPAAMLLSGIIDLHNGNYASAAQILDRLAAKQPDNRRVRQLLARALSLGQNDRELIYRYGVHAQQAGASPYLQHLVARSHEALGDRAQAGYLLDLAATARSDDLVTVPSGAGLNVAEARGAIDGQAALGLIRARINAGQAGAARDAAEQLLSRFSGSADTLALAADASFAAGNFEQAARHYAAAGTIRKPWLITRKQIKTLDLMGKKAEALAILARYFVSDPGNTEAAAMLARAAYMAGDFNSAVIFADHALRNGGNRDPVLHSMRAEIAMKLGDVDTGVAMASRGYTLQPMSSVTTTVLANVLREANQPAAPVAALERKAKRLLR